MNAVRVSDRLLTLAESLTVAVEVKIQERAARGEDIVNFGVGQPDFPTPPAVCEAARRAVEAGATRYTPPGGTKELRQEAAQFFRQRGIPATPADTVISCGAKHALYNAMVAVVGPGDEVLLPAPYWVTYPEQVKLAEAVPVAVAPERGLKVTPGDLERARTPRTRLLVLNSPNNPSGLVYDRKETEAIVRWCIERDVLILSDEIYDRMVYDGRQAVSPASLGESAAARTITVNGVSKCYAMTGWRIGFMTGPLEVMEAIVRFQGQTTGNPAAVSQAASLAALKGPQDSVETMRVAFERRRNVVVEALRTVPGVELVVPEGAFYAFPRVTRAARAAGGSVPLAERLIDRGVGIVPGAGFGADDHIRVSFAVSDDRLRVGMERLREGLSHLSA
ncbi:MAG TPA: pyridoxal phosphate-dependent aminotransferase [Candidatus Eisenbacteria bacterium]|nr:pyridoxal phosphate-dependent aminotransferase [Candidatus Eisenbacteria bacterium]